MTTPDNAPDTAGPGGGIAGRAADAIADGLNSHGFDVRAPAQPDSAFFQVTNVRGAWCEMTVFASGAFDWEYLCRDSSRTGPTALTAMIMRILGGDRAARATAPVARDPGLTLKGQIGRALAGHGMHVSLNVLSEDEKDFDVYAEIAAVNPACPDRGTVRAADDGLICWRGQIRDSENPEDGLDLDEITCTLAGALTTAHRP